MWLFGKKKKKSDEEEWAEVISYGANNAQDEESKRYYEALTDREYQANLSILYDLITEIKETYTVINNVSSFSSEAGDRLIDRCADAINLDIELAAKRRYYQEAEVAYSDPAKTLAMVFEKRGEYENAAAVCVLAIENGFTSDGTNGGMRGRLARMIKKGNLALTDDYRKILNL